MRCEVWECGVWNEERRVSNGVKSVSTKSVVYGVQYFSIRG